jgi:tRNA (Thr-GGU) A37 N-methylase
LINFFHYKKQKPSRKKIPHILYFNQSSYKKFISRKVQMEFKVKQIGTVIMDGRKFGIKLEEKYTAGLTSITGFSHLNILWWAHGADEEKYRNSVVIDKPYKKGPDTIGVFATRSQFRPNPIGITVIQVESIDYKQGIVYTYYIDAKMNTPEIDIKPYHTCTDIVSSPQVPGWCSHWPDSIEESGEFDWEAEFNFQVTT